MNATVINNRWTLIRNSTVGSHQSLIAGFTCFIALVLLPGCSSTHIRSTLNPAGTTAVPIHNLTVVGMDERPEFRNPFDNDAVGFLQHHGVVGNASHSRFTLTQMKGDREQIRQRLLDAEAESVLFVRVTDKTDSVPGAPPSSLGSLDMGAVDESRYNALTMPGGSVNSSLNLSARLYRVSDGVVIWTGLMDTIVKEDYDSIVLLRDVAKTIVDRMAKDKVIP